MTSKSPSRSFEEMESDADALMDELFREVEASFYSPTALTSGGDPPPPNEKKDETAGLSWAWLGVGVAAAIAALALWWSFVRLPQQLALQSGDVQTTVDILADVDTAETEGVSASSDSVLAEGDAAADADSEALSDTAVLVEDPPLVAEELPSEGIEVDQAEIDRILAATAPPPVYTPPAPVAYAPPPPPPAPDMRLVGIMNAPSGGSVALVMVGNNMRQFASGETIDGGWRVAWIGERSINVTNGARSKVLGL